MRLLIDEHSLQYCIFVVNIVLEIRIWRVYKLANNKRQMRWVWRLNHQVEKSLMNF